MTEHGRQQDDEYWYDYYSRVQEGDRPPVSFQQTTTKGEGTRVWWLVVASVVIAAVAIGLMAVA